MNTSLQTEPAVQVPGKTIVAKVFGVGSAGIKVMEQMIRSGLKEIAFVAVETDAAVLAASSAPERVHLESGPLLGLGSGGDPDRGRELAEESAEKLKTLCEGAQVVFIVTGLGGGAGTGISPVLARVAKETGALVLAFAVLPFQCEGARRQRSARLGLEDLKENADGVICLPNQKIFRLVDENTSVLDTFKLSNELLADGVRAVWRLLTHPGLIEIHFSDVCALIRDQHVESAFAVAEAMGPTRARDVMDKLMAHPMLEGGSVLKGSETVLVSLSGGADLTMAEVNRVMEQINQQCRQAKVIMGASIDEGFRDRLTVTVIAAQPAPESVSDAPERESEALKGQLLDPTLNARPVSRFVPPAPTLEPEQVQQLMERQTRTVGSRRGKVSSKMRQGQLPLEIVSKGRFDKSEPTIHKGEDLDVPTYIRRGVPLN